MVNKESRVLLMVSIALFSLAILSFGSFALWTSSVDLMTNENKISSGQVKMSYTEVNEIGMKNALPMKDSDGILLNDYFDFSVLSYMKTKDNDSTERKLNYNIVIEPIEVENKLDDSEIKVYLTKVVNGVEEVVVEPTTIGSLSNYILSSKEEVFSNGKGEVITSYRLRAWINGAVDSNKFNEKAYSYKFRINVNNMTVPDKTPMNASEFAKATVNLDGLEMVTHDIDDTLQVDNNFSIEYRYRGGDSVVKNYVKFNDEIWRIVGIIPTDDGTGNIENRFRIIRNESIGNHFWNECTDANDDGICDDTNKFSNDWTGSTLNKYLNNDYYSALSSDSKNMIGNTKYYLGGYEDSSIVTDVAWQYERKKANTSDYSYFRTNGSITNPISEVTKIGLMYGSDYGYAADNRCASTLEDVCDDDYCYGSNNWINSGDDDRWTIVQQTSDNNCVYFSATDAYISGDDVHYFNAGAKTIYPTITLSSSVIVSGGKGTSSEPYILSIGQ